MNATGAGQGRELVAFAFVGLAATLAYFVMASSGAELGYSSAVTSLAAYAIAALLSFAGHRTLTFRSNAPVAETAPRFAVLTALQFTIALLIPALLTDWAGWPAQASFAAVCLIIPAMSFLTMKAFVFSAGQASMRPPLARQRSWITLDADCLCLALCVFLFVLLRCGSELLNEPDTLWHVAAGRWIIEHRTFPVSDFFSFTFDGNRWIAKEWLAQVLLAAAWLTADWRGVLVLGAISISLTAFQMAKYLKYFIGTAGALIIAAFAHNLFIASIGIRPQNLAFPFFVGWLICLLRSAEGDRRPPWHAIPILWVWANLHPLFTIGLVLAGVAAAHCLINSASGQRFETATRWAIFLLASMLAVCLTPYGLEPVLLNFQMANGQEAMIYVQEWCRLTDERVRFVAIVVALLASVSLYVLADNPKRNFARLMSIAVVTLMTVIHARFYLFFLMVTGVAAGPAVWLFAKRVSGDLRVAAEPYLARLEVDAAWAKHSWQQAVSLGRRASFNHAAMILAAACVVAPALKPIDFLPERAPVAALAHVPDDFRSKRVFNDYDLGGFLVFNGIKTFIDGRSDQLFLGGFMTRVMTASASEDTKALAGILDEYKIEWAFVAAKQNTTKLFQKLPGWKPLYADEYADVYIREKKLD